LFSVPFEERNGKWAYELNKLRMEMIFKILESFPDAEEVQEKIPPFFICL